MLILSLLACGPATPDGGADSMPSAWVYEDTGEAPPALTTDGVAGAVNDVLAHTLHYNADVLFNAYEEVMRYADSACPIVTASEDGASQWETNCTASTGATFRGAYNGFIGQVPPNIGRSMRAEATVDTPDGARLVLAGNAQTHETADPLAWSSYIDGVMAYDGPAAAGTWTQEGVELGLEYAIVADDAGKITTATIDGNVGGLDGEVSAVAFTDVALASTPDWPCAAEPAGALAVRDANGVWADLTFDVTGDATDGYTIADGACDGCGTLSYVGTDLGQVCIDTGPLLDAVTPPW